MERDEQVGASAAKGIYHLFLGNVSATVLLALAAVVVGRVLGPADYGLYGIALIVPPFLFNATRFGLESASTRYGARLRSEGREGDAVSFVYSNMVFRMGIAAVCTILFVELSGSIATRGLVRPELASLVLPLAMVSILGEAAYTYTYQALTGLGRYDWAAALQLIGGVARLGLSGALVYLGEGVAGAIAGYSAAYLACGFIGIGAIASLSRSREKHFRKDVSTGLRYGFPVYLSTMASSFVLPLISIALALAVSNSQVGGYLAAMTFSTVILLFTYPITNGLFPTFSQKVEKVENLAKVYGIALRFTALLVVPVAAFLIAFAGPLMVTLYGPDFSFASGYLALVIATGLFAGVGSQAYAPFLNGIGHTKDALAATAVGSASSVASALILLQIVGVPGAIAGQMVGQGVAVAIATLLARRRLGVGLGMGRVWKTYAASFVTALVCYPLSWLIQLSVLSLFVGAVVFVVIYIPILALLRSIHSDDIDTLRRYLGFSPIISRPLELALGYYESIEERVGHR